MILCLDFLCNRVPSFSASAYFRTAIEGLEQVLADHAAASAVAPPAFVVGDMNLKNDCRFPRFEQLEITEPDTPASYRRQRYDRLVQLHRASEPTNALTGATVRASADLASAHISDHLAIVFDVAT